MFHDQKNEKILELLEIKPYWKSIELVKRLKASRSTIQRCLNELHDAGLAERIHGGIKRVDRKLVAPISLDVRIREDAEAKDLIANAAVKYLPKVGYVYLDAGTTVLPLISKFSNNSNSKLTYVTNDVAIASILAQKGISHELIGGKLHPVTQTLSGPMSLEHVRQYNFALCFISSNGIGQKGDVTCSVMEEALLKRQVTRQSSKKILLTSFSKWKKQVPALITKLKDFDVWISDNADNELKSLCKKNDVKLVVGR